MNRIDRLSAILIHLQSKTLVRAQDIASKYDISLRTVYRDVHALVEAGVPVIGEAGTGYRLMEGYRIPPIMFNLEEALALLTAGKLVLSKTDRDTSRHYLSALEKIRAILRHSEKSHLEDIDAHIAVIDSPSWPASGPRELHLQQLLKAIARGVMISIRYTSIDKNETLTRNIEPVGIYNQGTYWYLVAFCRLRNDYRNFRTDKIQGLEPCDEKVLREHPPLQRFIDSMTKRCELQKVVIEADQEIIKYFGEQKYYNGFISEEKIGSRMRMTFLTGSLQGFARWYLLFGERATILEPLALYTTVREIARNVLEKIEQEEALLT